MKNPYIGHEAQICSVEEHRLVGGRGDGMRLFEIRNGKGLELTISADRCADISRLTCFGENMGYFSPCGYVSSKYYDKFGTGFLKSFTAGFLTTCGLTAVGNICVDEGEELPLHGTISNAPAESVFAEQTEDAIIFKATVRQASLSGEQLLLHRIYNISRKDCSFEITDTCENIGPRTSPYMILYHFNIGYPLLSENAILRIPADSVEPRNDHAAQDIENCLIMEKPQAGIEERCYYHNIKAKNGLAALEMENPDIGILMNMEYSKETLPLFTQWKMMGETEYVLGLEPANCTPDGRDIMRKTGKLQFLKPGESITHTVRFNFQKI